MVLHFPVGISASSPSSCHDSPHTATDIPLSSHTHTEHTHMHRTNTCAHMHIAINRNMHNIFYLFQFLRVSRDSHYSGDRSTLSWTWVLPGRSLPSSPREGPHQPSFPTRLVLTLPQGPQPEKLPSLCLLRPTLSCGHGTMSCHTLLEDLVPSVPSLPTLVPAVRYARLTPDPKVSESSLRCWPV